MFNILLSLINEAFFAGMAAVGFALVSDPPKRLIIYTAILAAIGRGFRYFFIFQYDIGIPTATLIASAIIGFLGLYMAHRLRCTMEVVSFPAILPMVQDLYAY